VGLVGRNFEGYVGIQISHEMPSCKFSKFDLEILEQWRTSAINLPRIWGKLTDFFCSFSLSISQFRVNEHCKQIRSIHRELKSEFDLFIQFAKRVIEKFK
jgi:hypothetical protein